MSAIRPMSVLVLTLVCIGCTPKFVAKPGTPPEIVHCFDTVGHTQGGKPVILGGTCCCNPTIDVMQDWQAHGCFVGMSLDQIIAAHKEKGIALIYDHVMCNNMCQYGPHVVKGGKCIVPPTPGTENYEEVLFGAAYVGKGKAPKKYRGTVPSSTRAYVAGGQSK